MVSVCCSKGIQIVHPPTEARVTAHDVIDYARWADFSAENVVGNCFMYDMVPGENGEYFTCIPEDVWLTTLATNEARHINGQSRFFMEVKQLLQHQGHKVSIDYTGNPTEIQKYTCPKLATEQLLQAPDLSPRSIQRAQNNIFSVTATEEDKAAYRKAMYKDAWGVKIVDAEFVEQYGTEMGSEQQALLMRVLNPAESPEHMGDTWFDKCLIFKAVCVAELIAALGFKHPLDSDSIITTLEPLKQLAFIKNWEINAKVFLQKKPVAGKVMNERGLQETCRAVLRSIGIGLAIDLKRPRGPDGKQEKQRRYRLSSESCEEAGELMQLKGVVATEFSAANEWMQRHPLKRWAHLKLIDA